MSPVLGSAIIEDRLVAKNTILIAEIGASGNNVFDQHVGRSLRHDPHSMLSIWRTLSESASEIVTPGTTACPARKKQQHTWVEVGLSVATGFPDVVSQDCDLAQLHDQPHSEPEERCERIRPYDDGTTKQNGSW
jgi:hypothetical protein